MHMNDLFGRYLRQKRTSAGRSLRQVADDLRISHVYLGEIERGVRGPLKREAWDSLVKAIPGVTLDGLERAAAKVRPVQIDLSDAPPQYQDLALALARRINSRDLTLPQIQRVMKQLK